ncbi:AAA ATPase domain-containing protein [Micromonospora citrea]|uniref:AAA ATPase domain-containing protein n=2 Tax=Micromonospora citrea TaxID=47855 RepID=A0A1C6VXZ6_9ACTN|nr:AAA ATPase domain-containing protein [Micromonospora citrea]
MCATFVLYGDPGIGKTELLREFGEFAADVGIRVFRGRGTGDGRPFGTARDLVEDCFRTVGSAASAGLRPADVRVLRRLSRTAALLLPGPDPTAEEPAVEPRRVHEAVCSLLEAVSAEPAAVVLLDDLHRADENSVELFEQLLRRPRRGRLVVGAAVRPRQAPARLLRAVADAERRDDATIVDLAPLRPGDAGQLVDSWGVPPRCREAVLAAGDGNPLYLTALALAHRDASSSALPPPVPTCRDALLHLELPRPAHAALSADFDGLSARQSMVASAAALAGESFDPGLVAAVCRLTPGEVYAVLDALVDRDLIRPVPGGFRYRHPLLRIVAYGAASPVWRLDAHRAVEAALRDRGAAPSVRAGHVERYAVAGERAAVDTLVAAAVAAAETAPATSAHWLTVALRLLPGDEDSSAIEQRLRILRARSLAVAGRLQLSREQLHDVRRCLSAGSVEQRIEVAALSALVDRLLGRHVEARARLLREIEALPDRRTGPAVRLRLELAATWLCDRVPAEAPAWADETRELAAASGDPALLAAALAVNVATRVAAGTFTDQTSALADDAAAHVDALPDGDLRSNLEIVWFMSWAEIGLERFGAAQRHLARGLQLARVGGQHHLTTHLLHGQATVHALLGRLDAAAACAREALSAAAGTDSEVLRTLALTQTAWTAIWQGRLPEAVADATEAVRCARPETGWYGRSAQATLACARLHAGEPADCADLLGAGPAHDTGGLVVARSFWYYLLAVANAERGETATARGWAERAEHAAPPSLALPRAFAHLAHASALAGDPAAAAVAAQRAAALFEPAGTRLYAGRAHLSAAVAFGSAGRLGPARAAFARARAHFEQCGAERYLAEAVREERRMNSRRPRQRARVAAEDGVGRPERPALTDRELEVARMVTTGLTNDQIARRLFLSPRTIEAHLHRIFAKLGVNSRTAVAAILAAGIPPAPLQGIGIGQGKRNAMGQLA